MGTPIKNIEEGFREMKLPGMKPWYLRLDRFVQMYRKLLSEPGCRECQALAEEAVQLSGMKVEEKKEAGRFEELYISLFGRISDHLKEAHGYRLPNHYISRYTLVFMMAGMLAGLLIVWMGHIAGAGSWDYRLGGMLGFVAGLLTGRIAGKRKDREMHRDGKTIYEG